MTISEYLIEVGKLALEKAREEISQYEDETFALIKQAEIARDKRNQHLFQIENLKALTQLRYNELMRTLKKKGGVDPEIACVMNLRYEEVNNTKHSEVTP